MEGEGAFGLGAGFWLAF